METLNLKCTDIDDDVDSDVDNKLEVLMMKNYN